MMENKRHALITDLPEEPLFMEVDPVRIEQILVNLLSNAAKYTELGGRITLTLRQRGHTAEIRVKDTGIGVSKEMLELIFEPFVQLRPSPGRGSPGLGIGLSLTKRLVKLHGGSIVAESEGEQKGTEIIVTLPAPPVVQPFITESKESGSSRAQSSSERLQLRILIVDDNKAAAEGISRLLEHNGHTTKFHFRGEGVVSTAEAFNADVILLDIGLPDISGFDVARALRKSGSQARLIALSGYGQESDKQEALNAGFDTHITKPIGIDELEYVLREVMVGRKTIETSN